MYVVVQPSGAIVFRLGLPAERPPGDVDIGRYGPGWLNPSCSAREKVVDARRPFRKAARPRRRSSEKRRLQEAKSRPVR